MRLFKKLRKRLDYLDPEKIDLIERAYITALEAHEGQKRRTGEPYITHPVAVACILADMKLDHQTIMAALLHDVIEDTEVDKVTLEVKFDKAVAELVDGVSKLTQIEFVSRAEAQAENFRKMLLAMSRDIRVILVKLADRLHNMRTLGSLSAEKRHRIAKETLEIFAPIAKRLGMRDFSVELEELGFKARYPRRYQILHDAVNQARGNRKKMLSMISETITGGLTKSNIPYLSITGREKHLYSIYRKMRSKNIPFSEIMDVYAFRIIVKDVDTCYRVLGIVHGLFKPVPERFKDYIAIPKANGYQSLHTTLFGPYGLPIEVQIRTGDMDGMAHSGIAAHWLYKSDEADEVKPHIRAQKWVKNLLELQSRAGNSLEFIESVKVDLFPDEVYVFTPKGDIRELPQGATPIDFAYDVHTDIGNHTVAVKIDRQLAPVSTALSNGQTVEIITSANARPNPAWLDFVATSKARSAIRHFLKTQHKSESISLGKQLLQKALVRHSLSLKKLPQESMEFVLKEAKLKTAEDLYAEIGIGNRAATLVAQRLFDVTEKTGTGIEENLKPKKAKPLAIKGTEGMVLTFSECCRPIPGDPIIGVVSAGKGIEVHVDRCSLIAKLSRNAEQYVSLRWSEEVQGDFGATIRVQVLNQRGILASMALSVANEDGNIEDINIVSRDGQHYLIDFKLLIRNRLHLARVIRSIRQIPAVVKIMRTK